MIASQDVKGSLGPGMNPFLEVLDPGLVDPDRIGVLGLAGNGACVTADAEAIIDDKSIGGRILGIHSKNLPSPAPSGHLPP